jgi:hypothetical protein
MGERGVQGEEEFKERRSSRSSRRSRRGARSQNPGARRALLRGPPQLLITGY